MDIKENFKGHLSTINHHKMEVMRLCFKVGLYKQGLMHDLSKILAEGIHKRRGILHGG